MIGKLTIEKASLRIFCAILLLFVGLAHQPAAAQSLSPAGFAIYVLPDGTTSALCQPGETGKPVKAAWRGCEFCRITASTLLAPPPAEGEAVERRLIFAEALLVFRNAHAHRDVILIVETRYT